MDEAPRMDEAGRMDESGRVDGRTARGQRTRSAVVDALLALQEEGDLEPTAQRVAARAGVALRTVFGHFSDMETLWAQAGERELAKIAAMADTPSGDLPLDERVERFSASRALVLEALLPVLRAARLREHASAALRRNREIFAEAGDAEVCAVFATELDPLAEAERAVVLSAFHVVAGGTAWELLRRERELDVEAATDVLRRTVRRIVPTSGPL
jgi:AcrR family transcriptional regulator